MTSITSILLIVDSIQERDNEFEQAILDAGYTINAIVEPDGDFLYQINECHCDLFVANVDKVRIELMKQIALVTQTCPMPVIVFTPDENQQAIDNAIKSGVSAYIVDGFKANRIRSIIEVAIHRFKAVNKLQTELVKTKQRLSDRKVIDKAKGIVMKQKSIHEDEAYNLIRKMAMNKNSSMAEISANIIEVYELMA